MKGTTGLSRAERSVCWFMRAGLPSRPAPPGWAARHPASTGRVCGAGVARTGIRARGSPRVGTAWAGVPVGGPGSGGRKSETRVSLESAPSEAVRATRSQASLPASGSAGHFYRFLACQHITQISAFVFVWRSPCVRVPPFYEDASSVA